jgi:ribose-phosphate pyrophosphokinase
VTDTVPPFRLGAEAPMDKIKTVPAAPLVAETIRRLHDGRDLSDLMVF